MTNGFEDQRGEQRRREDRELALWRGAISTKVDAHETAISVTNGRLSAIQSAVSATRQDVAVIQTTMREQGADIARGQASNRALLLYLLFPLLVAILAGVILFALTGGLHR